MPAVCTPWPAQGTSRDDFGRLVLGDIIRAANDQPVMMSSDLYRVLDKSKVGGPPGLLRFTSKKRKHHRNPPQPLLPSSCPQPPQVGDEIDLEVLRGNSLTHVKITLEELA